MRNVHQSPLEVDTHLHVLDGGVWSIPAHLSKEQPGLYSEAIGAWRLGEYNGLAALPDGCFLAAWQSISEQSGGRQGLILTRRACKPD